MHMDLGFPETISGSVVTVPTRARDNLASFGGDILEIHVTHQVLYPAAASSKKLTVCSRRSTHLGTLSEAEIRAFIVRSGYAMNAH